MNFADTLLAWYEENKRDLPWRNTQNPYLIWLSEIILQQTRVKQGLPYYQKFVEAYPTLTDLANAPEDEVFRLWQGLGYYSRAKNMLHTAKAILKDYGGGFPNTFQELLKLKGVGKYTAAAIASFAFGEKVAVLDGNVFRVLARYKGIFTDIASNQGYKEFFDLAQKMLPKDKEAAYNQAIMEFGALQCTPQKPNCMFCPLQSSCYAYLHQAQENLPVKISKIRNKERFFLYQVFHYEEKIALRKRRAGDIWKNLYEFYLLELQEKKELENLHNASEIFKHQLTHQTLWVKFAHFRVEQNYPNNIDANLEWYSIKEVLDLPKPILIAKYLEEYLLKKEQLTLNTNFSRF
ncbi:MAG: A/G-specific adenine glycosylase [Raineya sp.]